MTVDYRNAERFFARPLGLLVCRDRRSDLLADGGVPIGRRRILGDPRLDGTIRASLDG
jgi:hypothetical protein